MKSAEKFIKVRQGMTTIVYSFYTGGTSRKVVVSHREVKPVIFRVLGRKFDFSENF